MRPVPEIMAPAGSWEMLRAVINAGADSVYFGGTRFNLRANHPVNFGDDEIPRVIEYAHDHAVRAYFLANIVPTSSQLEAYFAALDCVAGFSPDGLVLSSLGVIREATRRYPIAIIASVWTGVSNAEGALLTKSFGASSITAARQMTQLELQQLASRTDGQPRVRAFVVGHWCANLDGRCYMNSFLSGKRVHCEGSCGPGSACPDRSTPHAATKQNACRSPLELQETVGPGSFSLQEPGEEMPTSLKEIGASGVSAVKINGRCAPVAVVARHVACLRALFSSPFPMPTYPLCGASE